MKCALLTAALLAGCTHHERTAQVEGATLPECDQYVAAPDGPTIVVYPNSHEEQYKLPAGPVVRIAADRGVSWRRVSGLAARLRAQGSRPILLVGRGDTDAIGAFEPTEPLGAPPHLFMDVKRGGFFFGTETKGTQVTSFDETHIAKSFIRDEASPIVKQTGLHDVEVRVDQHINWADAVRAVDGARTCCPGTEVHAALEQ